MKLSLNKKSFKSLSQDNKQLPVNATPEVGGGRLTDNCTNHCGSVKAQTCDTLLYTNKQQTACCWTAMC
ncbi:hypothetical protein L1077_20695 [Pseudoalteromonas luteoviolacea]|uniref:Uncharacterized protein n=1 Tax=Pseudoalteromonas luteoviolacea H33 TaxID=1365251 RepID=A0A167AI89_9GAMM|nr:hypothetical protein [Pseudoalteromonas luteoviolacea]KZN45416.1 hypothetical protein N476_05200 [Pseudoalteromonas luteoviolacea H33]KZN70720.1 hypothetical protein N477_04840 [Pseudoalteromonas luteoviolacea H33-S]MBQ4880314.1 hypothetical protein [Pseudoalteromonas luteoviolacea]MBQ4909375.1 hypothetical protein [Pseudoalteromonas luteoviolacea]MCF6441859.1 hypothetical protein [Pseudoalteromonas luteoviolacea]